MKIQIVSDLHIEHRREQKKFKWWKGGVDVLVVAGDACDTPSMVRFREMLQPVTETGTQVIYVPGNHETYRAASVEAYEERLWAIFGTTPGVILLQNASVDILAGGKVVRFIGSTLWSDLSSPLDALSVRGWPDFQVPGHDTQRHTALHRFAVEYIHDACNTAKEDEVPAVVVTHFVPSYRSVHERFHGNPANPYFTTDLEWLMAGPEAPAVWIHGHTHDPFDYQCHKTRVVCNPYGYPRELEFNGYEFDTQKIIEVS